MYRIGKCIILCVTYLIQSANNRYRQQQLQNRYDTKLHEYDSINEPKITDTDTKHENIMKTSTMRFSFMRPFRAGVFPYYCENGKQK